MSDGIHSMVERDKMLPSAQKLRDTYAITPGIPLFRREFGFFSLERWQGEGLPADADLADVFQYDPPGNHYLGQLGWCEAALDPIFEDKILEDRGEYELVQDFAGRHVLFFKGRRNGFMPEYVDHPVKDMKTWEENILWRMNPETSSRFAELEPRMTAAREAAAQGLMIGQNLIGGYMYLRSLMGPESVLYAFYEQPELIHACMKTWFDLADAIIARHQQHVTLDEIFFAEDICYNHGPLIAPDTLREFLLPYYQQLIANVRQRQIDETRHLYIQIDTDGFLDPVISVYREIGTDVMSPFEVASNCDVVRTAKEYPDLVIMGGIDKRVMAAGPEAIDRHLEYIVPFMRERGGFIPTCDHGVPEEVSLENYMHYRKRMIELGG